MNLSPEVAVALGIVLGLVAYLMGRNPVIWFLLGYALPAVAWFLLLVRHVNKRKQSPDWVLEAVNRAKLKMWARDLKPEDFNDGPGGGEKK